MPSYDPLTVSSAPQILNDNHCRQCTDVISMCNQALDVAGKCKDCGMPVDDLIAEFEQYKQMATKIKQNFFPSAP